MKYLTKAGRMMGGLGIEAEMACNYWDLAVAQAKGEGASIREILAFIELGSLEKKLKFLEKELKNYYAPWLPQIAANGDSSFRSQHV